MQATYLAHVLGILYRLLSKHYSWDFDAEADDEQPVVVELPEGASE